MISEGAPRPEDDPGPEAELATAFATPRRLHVAAAVSSSLVALRGLALPLVAVAFLGRNDGGMARAAGLVLLGALFALVAGVVTWRTTRYQLLGGTLRLRSGAFSPDDTVVPVARVQAVDTVQGPVQRLFGVVELHVQTPGGGAAGEIVLAAVAPADARALRAALGHAEPATDLPRRRLGAGGLLLAAVTAPQFGVVLPIVGALFAGAQDLFGNGVGEGLAARVDTAPEALRAAGVILGAALLVSVLAGVVAFAGFEVERDGDRLRIRRGLLQRRAASVPVARIDGVAIVEGLLRAPFGLATVRLETAGYRAEQAPARTLFPLLRTRDVPALLAELLPGLPVAPDPGREPTRGTGAGPSADLGGPGGVGRGAGAAFGVRLERPPARSLRRYATTPALVGVVLGAVAVAVAGPESWWWLAVLGGLLGVAHGLLGFRAAGLLVGAERVVLRERRGTARVTLLARPGRLQETGVRRSPLQRRARLASFELALGSGRRGRVRHLDAPAADGALDALRR